MGATGATGCWRSRLLPLHRGIEINSAIISGSLDVRAPEITSDTRAGSIVRHIKCKSGD